MHTESEKIGDEDIEGTRVWIRRCTGCGVTWQDPFTPEELAADQPPVGA